MKNIRISIIIPIKNMAHFLRECLFTLRKQQYTELEVILVDAYSSDGVERIIDEYKDLNINHVLSDDKSQADAVTTGIRMATGDIIHWHAADDLFMPEALKYVNEFFSKNDVDLIYSDGRSLYENRLCYGHRHRFKSFNVALLFFDRFESDCAYFKRKIAMKGLPLDASMPLNCDEDFFLRIWEGSRYSWVDHPLGVFRSHGDQISKKLPKDTLWDDRRRTRALIFERLGYSTLRIRGLRVLYFPYYVFLRVYRRAFVGFRFLKRILRLDSNRRTFERFFFNEYLER